MDNKERDLVGEYVEARQWEKDVKAKIGVLKTLILAKPDLLKDTRIKVVEGRKRYAIHPDTYKRLEMTGVNVLKEGYKDLKDFDIDIQEIILSNPDNYLMTQDSPQIRVNKKGAKKT